MIKQKIGIVHYTYPPVIGGVEKIIFDHAQLFAENDYPTTIISGDGKNENPKINFIHIPEIKSLGIINPVLREKVLMEPHFTEEFYQMSDLIYSKMQASLDHIDVLFIHNIMTLTFNPCVNFALVKYIKNHPNKKFIIWIHDIILDPMRKKKSFLNIELEELIYKPLANVTYIGISNFLKKTLVQEIGYPEHRINIIPNGININSLLNLHPLTKKIFSRFKLDHFDYLIFLPTKIMRHKNIDLCLKIFNEIKKLYPSSLLVVTAKNFPHNKDHSYVSEIQNLINELKLKNNVLFLHEEIDSAHREIEYKVVDDFYRLSDIVFFLSSFENFGLPLLESGITKTPILVSNLEVFKEIESENIYYADLENESYQQIAAKVIEILKNNKQISFFNKVKKTYNFDFIFNSKIIPLIEEI